MRSVKSTQAAVRAEPQVAVPVLPNGHHHIVCQSIFRSKGGELILIESAHPSSVGPNPQRSAPIFQN